VSLHLISWKHDCLYIGPMPIILRTAWNPDPDFWFLKLEINTLVTIVAQGNVYTIFGFLAFVVFGTDRQRHKQTHGLARHLMRAVTVAA